MISPEHFVRLKDAVYSLALQAGQSYDYQIIVADMICDDEIYKDGIFEIIRRIVNWPDSVTELTKFVLLFAKYHDDLALKDLGFFTKLINDRFLDEAEIRVLAEFIDDLGVDDKELSHELKISLEHFIEEELNHLKTDIEISEFVRISHGEDEEEEVSFEEEAIRRELSDIATSLLKDFEFQFNIFSGQYFDIDALINQIDINEMVAEYLASQVEVDYDGHHLGIRGSELDIHDLFERT